MTKAAETIEAKIEMERITLAHKMESARKAVLEMQGFSDVNSFCMEHSICQTAKMLVSIAIDIQKTAASLGTLRTALELVSRD
jgi:hypothetical protein